MSDELFPTQHVVVYVDTETQANEVLREIMDGEIGIDTELTERIPTIQEHAIIQALPASPNRKTAILGWQIVELAMYQQFPVAWDNMGLRLVQIARDDTAWVLDMRRMRALPNELRRILLSGEIKKVGVGILRDAAIIWEDLRTDMKNVVDAGMMARLLLVEKYQKQAYSNLSLKISVEEILGFTIKRDLSQSDWGAKKLNKEQIAYAALDAVAALKLYRATKVRLERKKDEIHTDIPTGWYTFNMKWGEPTRMKPGLDGSDVPWKHSDCTWFGGGKFLGYYP
ncbi:ribonuclease H-like domain-containing protein [Mycena leptocephala]|nr:ribonuclease H-like domain-containing protein [Mycena leptocephala]